MEKERERNNDVREKHQLVASCMTGDRTRNLGMCPDLNRTSDHLSHTSQGYCQAFSVHF